MAAIRTIIAGIGALGAAGAAVVTGVSMRNAHTDGQEIVGLLENPIEICLQTKVVFFGGAPTGCVGQNEILRWQTAQVVDNQGAPISVSMSHPTDVEQAREDVRNCAAYNRLKKEDWYAGSTREIRREAYFERACGILDYLRKAKAPRESFFENGRCSKEDMISMADGPPFKIIGGPDDVAAVAIDVASEDLVSESIIVNEAEQGIWQMSSTGQAVRVHEIAHADFDGDGVGDILAHVFIGIEDATASAGLVGYLVKSGPEAPVRFKE